MPKRMSDDTKQKLHLGTGLGKDYRTYLSTSEFNSQGTTSVVVDWKTGRGVHCMSQNEMFWYYILRWNYENIDIREDISIYEDFDLELWDAETE